VKVRHPTAKDIERGLAVCHSWEQQDGEEWIAIVLDVSAAHKRLRLAEEDAGVSFFRCRGQLFRYLVAHFGAAWSAWWESGTAAAVIRLMHIMLGTDLLAFVYVDDFLILVRRKEAWRKACLLAMLLCCLGVPLSWHKLTVCRHVKYVGLLIDMTKSHLDCAATK